MSQWLDSPFVVPVAGCAMILGISVARVFGEVRSREAVSQERASLLARGMSVDEVERVLAATNQAAGRLPNDPLRALRNTRRTATVLIFSGAGIVVFGLLLWLILQVRPVLTVAAAGLINVMIGIGFLVDYRMQQREIARFHPDVATDLEM